MSSVISFAYFTHFSNLNISPELMQIKFANGKGHFHSFMELYVIKKSIGKNLIIVPYHVKETRFMIRERYLADFLTILRVQKENVIALST